MRARSRSAKASAAASFGNTSLWNGIGSITSGEHSFAGNTVSSLSGANDANSLQPIMLPAPAWLFISGVGVLAWRGRR